MNFIRSRRTAMVAGGADREGGRQRHAKPQVMGTKYSILSRDCLVSTYDTKYK